MSFEVVIYCMSCSTVDIKVLPWDKMTYYNHAFWKIEKKGNKKFPIVSCFPEYDFGTKRNNFKTLEEVHQKHPKLNIILSIGGAGLCRYFSEMALTKESRKTFIDSCIETMKKYPFFTGIDVDWEFPGITYNEDPENPGCLKVGNDRKNYPLLIKEMREAFDNTFGKGAKKLTVCAPASAYLLALQGIPKFHKYVDLINMMTYDLDPCNKKAEHHTALYRPFPKQCVNSGAKLLMKKGVPRKKIVIGSPFYSRGCKLKNIKRNGKIIGTKGSHSEFNGIIHWNKIKGFESQAVEADKKGWHKGYDKKSNGAYMWNDDQASKYFKYYISYESQFSLDVKLDYIKNNNFGGIIIWDADGDVHDGFPLINQMAKSLMDIDN